MKPIFEEERKFLKEYGIEVPQNCWRKGSKIYANGDDDFPLIEFKVDELNNSLVQYKTLESTLQSTLVMAQSTAEEVKNVAKQKADQIVDEAKSSVQKQLDELNNEILLKQKELEDIKKQFDIYKAKMESLLISQLELLKDVNKDSQLY